MSLIFHLKVNGDTNGACNFFFVIFMFSCGEIWFTGEEKLTILGEALSYIQFSTLKRKTERFDVIFPKEIFFPLGNNTSRFMHYTSRSLHYTFRWSILPTDLCFPLIYSSCWATLPDKFYLPFSCVSHWVTYFPLYFLFL